MGPEKHSILDRHKHYQTERARPEHFTLGPARPINERELVMDPRWSLYCLDSERKRALFVHLPPGLDLTTQPFVYIAQFDHATEVAFLSIDSFLELSSRLPRPRKLVHLFSTGRCGSTLASKVFANLEGVWSVSEPDAVSPLATNREGYGNPESISLIEAVTRWTYKPHANAGAHTCVLKYRSEAVFHASDFMAATPEAVSLFQYRDLLGWCASIYGFAQKVGVDVAPGPIEHWTRLWNALSAETPPTEAEGLFDVNDRVIEPEALLCALWVLRIEAFQEFTLAGHQSLVYSYRDLTLNPEQTLSKLLDGMGCEFDGFPGTAMKAFETDSHAGTAGARSIKAKPLGNSAQGRLRHMLSSNERVRSASRFLETLSL